MSQSISKQNRIFRWSLATLVATTVVVCTIVYRFELAPMMKRHKIDTSIRYAEELLEDRRKIAMNKSDIEKK